MAPPMHMGSPVWIASTHLTVTSPVATENVHYHHKSLFKNTIYLTCLWASQELCERDRGFRDNVALRMLILDHPQNGQVIECRD